MELWILLLLQLRNNFIQIFELLSSNRFPALIFLYNNSSLILLFLWFDLMFWDLLGINFRYSLKYFCSFETESFFKGCYYFGISLELILGSLWDSRSEICFTDNTLFWDILSSYKAGFLNLFFNSLVPRLTSYSLFLSTNVTLILGMTNWSFWRIKFLLDFESFVNKVSSELVGNIWSLFVSLRYISAEFWQAGDWLGAVTVNFIVAWFLFEWISEIFIFRTLFNRFGVVGLLAPSL